MSDHYIICGYGRVGRRIAAEFLEEGVRFVVLDFSPEAIEAARERNLLYVDGSGIEDEDLEAAGLSRATGLVASSDSDADNLYITLSARNARPDLLIVARASDEDAAKKLRLAGADRVVQPYSTAGKEMAKLVLRPQVAAFLDIVSTSGGPELLFEEIEVKESCREAGKSIRDLRIRQQTGAMIVALRKGDGTFDTTPEPDAVLDVGDVMIAAGTPEELRPPRGAVRARPKPLPDAVARLEARLSELAGAAGRAGAAERSRARRLRDQRRDAARAGAAPLAAGARRGARGRRGRAGRGRARRGRRPRLRQPLADAGLVRRGAGRDPRPPGTGYGGGSAEPPEKVQVEMVSANPTGPITVASARNGAIGDSVARQLEFAGHEVSREYYYNDAGAQMERFRASVEAVRRGEEPPEDGYQGDYIAELAAEPRTTRCRRCSRQIEASLERFRIHFDSWMLQSELEQRLPEFLPRVDTYEKDGAVWARSSAYGDDEDRVIIRSPEQGGTPTYRAADIVYLVDKLERGFDRALYVLGADHHGTRKWYEAVARMLGYDPARVEVLLYQLVHLTRGGEQAKMSKRRGDVVFLDEFMDEVGVDAARWYLVNRGPDQTIEIDVDLAAERSEKNPVYYVQYAHARIAAIRRNAGDAEVSADVPGGARRRRRRTSSSGWPTSPRSPPRRPSGAARTRSRPTRSASPTTSTASTTTSGCSRARRRRSGSASARRRRT